MEKITKDIKEAKGKFFKRLSKFIFDERVESYHLATLKRTHYKVTKAFTTSCSIPVSKTREILDYRKLNELLAILRTIDTYYDKTILTYHPDDILYLCETIRRKYRKSFWAAMEKHIGIKNYKQLSEADAYKELVYRGFKPNRLLTTPKTKNEYYIQNTPFGLVHPVMVKDQKMAQDYQGYLGITGHTGYFDPNRK